MGRILETATHRIICYTASYSWRYIRGDFYVGSYKIISEMCGNDRGLQRFELTRGLAKNMIGPGKDYKYAIPIASFKRIR